MPFGSGEEGGIPCGGTALSHTPFDQCVRMSRRERRSPPIDSSYM